VKKINKSVPPNKLTEYATRNPTNDWEQFRKSSKRKNYKNTKQVIFDDQGGLCAFCEDKVQDKTKQQIEHFHSKKDNNPTLYHNWALDWDNVMGVCSGGKDADQNVNPLPANLSCDAYKDHLILKNRLSVNCEGYLLNPLHLPAFPCLFDFNIRTGELKQKNDYSGIEFKNNQYGSTAELVAKTIEHLNLNCDRLNKQRLEVLKLYNQEVAKARKNNDRTIFTKLVQRWFQKRWISFFTTRRILLGEEAENYLKQINYEG